MTRFEATSRQQAGRIVAGVLEFTDQLTVTDVSGSEMMFIVEADLRCVANEQELASLFAIV
jgi:hypothetical protein